MPTPIGRKLNREWGVNARHALYRENGKWYMPLERFPGAYFDAHGYLVFPTKHSYETCRHIRIGKRVNVPGGIQSLPGYVRHISN